MSKEERIGVYEGLSNEDYHADSALGSSSVKVVLKSLAHFKSYMSEPPKVTKALDFGTACHSAILEQDFNKYTKAPDVRRGTIAWKEHQKTHPDKILLKPDEYSSVKQMYEKFWSHKIAPKLTKLGKPEISFFAVDPITGLRVKARADYFVRYDNKNFVVDYKTARDASDEGFAKAIWNYRYDISAAFYMYVIELATGVRPDDFIWIAQDKDPPHLINTLRAPEAMITRADARVKHSLGLIKQAKETDIWPGYDETLREVELDDWAIRKEESYE